MIDYFSYLRALLVEHKTAISTVLGDEIVALTQDERFPLSQLYRLYRQDQARCGPIRCMRCCCFTVLLFESPMCCAAETWRATGHVSGTGDG